MTVKQHYDNHLAIYYSWMVGDFEQKRKEFELFLEANLVHPTSTKIAIDLGAGHGIQSVALSNLGYSVTAIDLSKQLLSELEANSEGKPIKTIRDDIRQIEKFKNLNPELILCFGDTITHLDSVDDIKEFIENCAHTLCDGGKFIVSFRNYTEELTGNQRFIPVKSDEDRILTCILEYEAERVTVTDLFHEKTGQGWVQKVSSYHKVRIGPNDIIRIIEKNRMRIVFYESLNGMQTIIAEKQKIGSYRINQ